MKILTRKQQDELLLRITANEIIAVTSIDEGEELKQHIENAFAMADIVGGLDGARKVQSSLEQYMVKEEESKC